MSIAGKWAEVDVVALAADWLREIRLAEPRTDDDVGSAVVLMNFTAGAEVQWAFLNAAVDAAASDDELGAIAAGPLEHLLSRHGDHYITLLEDRCRTDSKFARMTTTAWRHQMNDEVWSRLQAIRSTVKNPL